jgi:type IV pilus assembly protein PilA
MASSSSQGADRTPGMNAPTLKVDEERDGGFTLIELLVVVIIIGILAAIAIPVFLSQRQKGWDAQAKSDLRNMATAEETVLGESGSYTANVFVAGGSPSLQGNGFRRSADSSNYLAVPDALNPAYGYCLSLTSKSGRIYVYDSVIGYPAQAAAPCA